MYPMIREIAPNESMMTSPVGPPPPQLPPEITDRIMDCLRGDAQTLCSCALTCHAWLPRSQYNIYRMVELRSRAALTLLAIHSRRPHTYLYMHEALHELHLYDTPRQNPTSPEPQRSRTTTDASQPRSFVHLVPLVLSPHHLSSVKILEISSINWVTSPVNPSFPFQGRMFPQLVSLTLSECTFGSFGELRRMLLPP
ncbi:hypothetical protein B0H21DRAFT_124436 [Amylocystis lapponica]|nr:hypothetical protein B0H21DRAFT_124436 [Amylocystis lapponica]